MAINPASIAQISQFKLTGPSSVKTDNSIESSFGDYLKNAISDASKLQTDASIATENLATGQIDDIHSVMIAVEKSEIALQFTMAVRNKILDAYNEIMRMQI